MERVAGIMAGDSGADSAKCPKILAPHLAVSQTSRFLSSFHIARSLHCHMPICQRGGVLYHLLPISHPFSLHPSSIGSRLIRTLLPRHSNTRVMSTAPESFIGQSALELPSPSLVLSRPIMEQNASAMLADVAAKGFSFRPHVKTLKVLFPPSPDRPPCRVQSA